MLQLDSLLSKKVNMSQNLQDRAQVYAIDAKWGAGKTTFIRLVKDIICQKHSPKPIQTANWKFGGRLKVIYALIEALDQRLRLNLQKALIWLGTSHRQGKHGFIWIDFNPWNYLSGEKMVVDFFETLDNRISKIYGHKLGKKLTKYLNLLIKTSPKIFGVSLDFSYNPFKQNLELESLKKEVAQSLNSIKEKILIVIDDVDRLPPETVLTVLRLVGITANFPNVFFILAMDYHKVEKIVQEKLGQQYQNYLQKIVNERIALPKWSYSELEKIFESYTSNAIQEIKRLTGIEQENEWWLEIVKPPLTSTSTTLQPKYVSVFDNFITKKYTAILVEKVNDLLKKGKIDRREDILDPSNKLPSFGIVGTDYVDNLGHFLEKINHQKRYYGSGEIQGLEQYFDRFFGYLMRDINNISSLEDIYLHLQSAIIRDIANVNPSGNQEIVFNLFLEAITCTEEQQIRKKSESICHYLNPRFKDTTNIINLITLAQKVKDYLTNYDGLVEAELSLTPRDIKQLANAYIYSVARVYDGFLEEGKKPRDHQQAFRQRLNLELAKTIEKEAKKQAQKNTPKIKP